MTRIVERSPSLLRAEAVWHEDVHDPGDASLVEVRLAHDDGLVRFAIADVGSADYETMATLRKRE